MSGGSWDYITYRFDDVAERLLGEKDPLRRAFGKHMKLIAHAMHEIEWVDSGDKSSPSDTDAIKAVFGSESDKLILQTLIEDARVLIEEMQKYGA